MKWTRLQRINVQVGLHMKFLVSVAVWFALLIPLIVPRAAAQGTRIVIAYTTISPTYAPIWIAKEVGFFEKHGLNAETIFMRGATMGTQALVSGGINFLYAGGSGAVEAALSGAQIVIIAVPSNRMDQVLVTKKEITDPKELKHKKIAVNSLTGTAILALKIMLNALGFNPEKDVIYMALGDPASRFAALRTGLVDATVLSPPFTLTAKRAGLNIIDDIPVLEDLDYPSASLIARKDSVRTEPVLIDKTTRAIVEAVHFYKTKRTETKQILQKYLRLSDPDELEEAYLRLNTRFINKPYPTVESVKTILEWSKHPKAKTVDPAQFVNRQFVEKLDKEGFFETVFKSK
jgi:NitT/TauT family transport system substrate-binding protein